MEGKWDIFLKSHAANSLCILLMKQSIFVLYCDLTLNCLSSTIFQRQKDSWLWSMPVRRNMRPIKGRDGSWDFINLQGQTFWWSVLGKIALSHLVCAVVSAGSVSAVSTTHNPLLWGCCPRLCHPGKGDLSLCSEAHQCSSPVGSGYTVSMPSVLSSTKLVGSSGCWDDTCMNGLAIT